MPDTFHPDDSGPAFPVGDVSKTQCLGMSLRDYFAGQALAGAMANPANNTLSAALSGMTGQQLVSACVHGCYAVADLMLEAREKGGEL